MLTASPSSWKTVRPHPSRHPHLLKLTHSQSRDLPQRPTGRLLCFSWAFHSTVTPVHLADEEPEAREGKQLAQGHPASRC